MQFRHSIRALRRRAGLLGAVLVMDDAMLLAKRPEESSVERYARADLMNRAIELIATAATVVPFRRLASEWKLIWTYFATNKAMINESLGKVNLNVITARCLID